MKRRNFLAASTLSLGAIIQSRASSIGFSPTLPEQNFLNYVDRVGGVAQSIYLLDDQKLSNLFTACSSRLVDIGFRNTTNKFYLLSQSGVVMLPLFLEVAAIGVIDVGAVFFCRDQTGTWKNCATFSGFHFEAINQAVAGLVNIPGRVQLANLITPVLSNAKEFVPGCIETIGGKMVLTTRIGESTTTMDFQLIQGNTALLSSVFTAGNKVSESRLA